MDQLIYRVRWFNMLRRSLGVFPARYTLICPNPAFDCPDRRAVTGAGLPAGNTAAAVWLPNNSALDPGTGLSYPYVKRYLTQTESVRGARALVRHKASQSGLSLRRGVLTGGAGGASQSRLTGDWRNQRLGVGKRSISLACPAPDRAGGEAPQRGVGGENRAESRTVRVLVGVQGAKPLAWVGLIGGAA